MRLRFDRGTLLIDDPPPLGEAERLPGVLWDPRVRAFRAPAHRYADVVARLRALGAAYTDELRLPGLAVPGRWRLLDLRPYQEAAYTAWQVAGRRGIAALPTGSGKTRLALAAMAKTRARTLCVVPTRVLLHQWRAEIERAYDGPVGVFGDREHRLAPITVATFESAYRYMEKLGQHFALLVVDEAHHFGNAARDEALEMAVAPLRLGLTATPPADEAVLRRLDDLVGPVVYELEVADLAGRWLAPLDYQILRLPMEPDERAAYEHEMRSFRPVYRQFRRSFPGGTWREFLQVAAHSAEGRAAVAAHRQARRVTAFTRGKARALGEILSRHRSSRVLVFTPDNDSAYAVSREHLLMPLTCDIRRKEREDALARFRQGTLRGLVSCRVLNEGLDVPDAEVAVVVGGTLGEREHVQRIGRLLRPAAGKRALVYELVALGTNEVRQSAERRRSLRLGSAADATEDLP